MNAVPPRVWAYLAMASGFLAVLLGFLTLNGVIPYSLVSHTEAVLGLGVGSVTIYIGRRLLKALNGLGG